MRNRLAVAIASAVALWSAAAAAAPTACPEHFAGGAAPDLLNAKLAPQTQEICYRGYAVLYSGLSMTGLWSAEHLTRERVQAAKGMERNNDFHPDPSLRGTGPTPQMYARTGYDRGHMAPSGDMPDAESQRESFSMANMMPQTPEHNRVLWEGTESAVRAETVKRGELYVVTGPAFLGSKIDALNRRVMVPTHIWKVIYDPKRGEAGAYFTANDASQQWQAISVAELARTIGVDPLPGVPASVKDRAMDLPVPTPHNHRASADDEAPRQGNGAGALIGALGATRRLLR